MCKTFPSLSYMVLLFVVVPVCLAQLPDVPEEAIEALGKTEGTPQSNGFVFFEGRYIAPPYTVTRKGNGIFVNRIQVEQPFACVRVSAIHAKAVSYTHLTLPTKRIV